MAKAYYHPLDCEADYYRSIHNKQDLIYLIRKYGKDSEGKKYKIIEFKDLSTVRLRQVWNRVEHKITLEKNNG